MAENMNLSVKDVKAGMTNNVLLLNTDKTEVMIVGPKHLRMTLFSHLLTLDGMSLTSNTSVKDLGVTIDQDLSFDSSHETGLKEIIFLCTQ